MKLPNAHLALVERVKIVDYPLNPAHRHGGEQGRAHVGSQPGRQAWSRTPQG
jgi:hypothetical protein